MTDRVFATLTLLYYQAKKEGRFKGTFIQYADSVTDPLIINHPKLVEELLEYKPSIYAHLFREYGVNSETVGICIGYASFKVLSEIDQMVLNMQKIDLFSKMVF